MAKAAFWTPCYFLTFVWSASKCLWRINCTGWNIYLRIIFKKGLSFLEKSLKWHSLISKGFYFQKFCQFSCRHTILPTLWSWKKVAGLSVERMLPNYLTRRVKMNPSGPRLNKKEQAAYTVQVFSHPEPSTQTIRTTPNPVPSCKNIAKYPTTLLGAN